MFYLSEDLEHDCGFARTGIADDLHVLRLGPLRYAYHCLHSVGLDTYSISSNPVVELIWGHHLGAFESSSVPQLFATSDVLADSKRELDDQ